MATQQFVFCDELVKEWLFAFCKKPELLKKIECDNKEEVINKAADYLSLLTKSAIVREALVEAASEYGKEFDFDSWIDVYPLPKNGALKLLKMLALLRLHATAANNNCLSKQAVAAAFEYYVAAVILVLFWDQK